MPIDHPIHVHLINFQVISKAKLRVWNYTDNPSCSLYEIDFYKEANVPHIANKSDADACYFIVN